MPNLKGYNPDILHNLSVQFLCEQFSSQAAFHSPSPYISQVPSDNILKEVAEKIHR